MYLGVLFDKEEKEGKRKCVQAPIGPSLVLVITHSVRDFPSRIFHPSSFYSGKREYVGYFLNRGAELGLESERPFHSWHMATQGKDYDLTERGTYFAIPNKN